VHNNPFCVYVATYHKWALQIKIKIILRVIIAIEKHAEPFDINKLSQRTNGTVYVEPLPCLAVNCASESRTTRWSHFVTDAEWSSKNSD
jgi:hypothetical protein